MNSDARSTIDALWRKRDVLVDERQQYGDKYGPNSHYDDLQVSIDQLARTAETAEESAGVADDFRRCGCRLAASLVELAIRVAQFELSGDVAYRLTAEEEELLAYFESRAVATEAPYLQLDAAVTAER